LGIGFIEISAIAGAIEIIVGVLKTRAPGQSLDKLPVYSWVMLVFAFMIVFAFPAVILATTLLELERALGWPFFIAEKGGDPLLWQHLFWFFGHPEVYIIFLPAAGMVSMMIPTMAQTPLVGYRLVVLAVIGTGFLSFGLWVHHMFATGLPHLSLSFFSAASMAVAIPTGIQVFAWIGTIASGKLQWTTPTYFILGFLFIFVMGGLTGVMVAMMPFDWQAHDTYFIVAHLHYVLIGGMVFPLFAALYYWVPIFSKRPLSEYAGKWAFWLIFLGVNITFFTMHITGLMGMPRRVYTYIPVLNWGTLNLISTLGSYMIAAGVLVILFDLARNFRFSFDDIAGNIWNAGTLEWLPTGTFQTRSIPIVTSREPLWDQRNLASDAKAGRYYLPGTATGGRETIVTSPIDARPQYLLQVPGPSWSAPLAAIFTAAFFLLLTVKLVTISLICGVTAIIFIIVWMWGTDPGPSHPPVDIGGGIKLPVYATGSVSHSWWAVIVLILVAGTLFTCLIFSYLYLWTVNPNSWPPANVVLPELVSPVGALSLFAASSVTIAIASRSISRPGSTSSWPLPLALLAALALMILAYALQFYGIWLTGLRPQASSYGAVVYMFVALQGFFVGVMTIMGLYTIARWLCGLLDGVRRATFDNTMLLWHYTTSQAIVGLSIVTFFPRVVG
jgi:cytochrome c oxidase subunit I+III